MFKLEPSDVLLYVEEGTDPVSLISKWGAGRYRHAALYGGKLMHPLDIAFIIESSGRGATIVSITSHTGRLVKVMRPAHEGTDKFEVLVQAIKIAANPSSYYDYQGIAWYAIPRVLKTKFPFLPIPPKYVRDGKVICSELVAEAFWRAGINVLPENKVPLPVDFETSDVLEPVYEGRILKDIII